jgi:tocopherol cyclase
MKNILRWWRGTLNPDWFHGNGHKPPFFEGWYYKLIDKTTRHKWVIIPGVFLGSDPHAFIQVMDGSTSQTWYHRFAPDQFWAAPDRFEIQVGENHFTAGQISMNLERPEQSLHGSLRFSDRKPWPVNLISPGIMGWYAWVPTMECYHGVLSLDHAIEGELNVDGQSFNFSGGRGYIEKDWGQSFPSAWVWMQSNHFESAGTSLTASIAMIPWRKTRFRGFIVGFWFQGKLYRFATYTGARTVSLKVDDHQVDWVIRGRTQGAMHTLHIVATRGDAGILAGPSTVDMGKRVAETLTAKISVVLKQMVPGRDQTIFAGNGSFAGLEVQNVFEELVEAEKAEGNLIK